MAYRIALIHNAKFPVAHYGGTERVLWWLAKGLSELGHSVVLLAAPGSFCPFAETPPCNFPSKETELPPADIYHYFNTPEQEPQFPYLVTIGGNAKSQERFLPNTVFVSRNHAERHGASAFVYNGVDPDDYLFSNQKMEELLFLAKASWNVKNVKGAISVARKTGLELQVVGGSRKWLPRWRGVYWRGFLGGKEKAQVITRAKGLIFPVLWDEPFGIAVVEALVSGVPVLATPFGSLKELIPSTVGQLCTTYREFTEGVSRLGSFKSEECREWALSKFHYLQMTKNYLTVYEKVLSGEKLHPQPIEMPVLKPFKLFELPEH
ncbi:MAG: glycosyltransferase [Proteobacteria bacterium]|nr:glycosyltransferase [Pseudomonadota bacterium]NDC25341.1 glycosyltransferase [Pseudomonadota bacterium]NDD05743.1 glycosyltransferase [Pseudomonadota bacterium]